MITKSICRKLLLLLIPLHGVGAELKIPAEGTLVAQYGNSRGSASAGRQRQALKQALEMARLGQYVPASKILYQLSQSPALKGERMQIRYILGLMLFELKLNQVAAFQFLRVVNQGSNRYTREALEKLSLAADKLNDDKMLNYAISQVDLKKFPPAHKDMLNYRLGEYYLGTKNQRKAVSHFSKVNRNSRFYHRAKYKEGLAYAEAGRVKSALRAFGELAGSRRGRKVTDPTLVTANLARARVLYQAEQWDESVKVYRSIPRDTEQWHEALFESSWTLLRAARFRSVLSNFHSLHSDYYKDFYFPESLLLRAIVYLYICKYEEMEKVLTNFETVYGPVKNAVDNFIKVSKSPESYFKEIEKAARIQAGQKGITPESMRIPYLVAKKLLEEGDVSRSIGYLASLKKERARIRRLPREWRDGAIGKFANKVLSNRIKNTEKDIGRLARAHLLSIRTELQGLYKQAGFIRFEMINGQKELLKKRVAGKTAPEVAIDEDSSRSYYIQNGYEYWPFKGEYWLDEIGNYHYLGTQSCR